MPIIDLQRRLVEVGRIRMGKKNARGHPERLDTWRLTSSDQDRLKACAELFGGEVVEWTGSQKGGEWELITERDSLEIIVLPGYALSQNWEHWSGGGCQRRCEGFGGRELIGEQPCVCEADGEKEDERTCDATSRLSVMLPQVPGLGHWRLESHGYYAAVELMATASILESATARGQMVPARLRIDQRRAIRDGKTSRYAVPVIDILTTLPELSNGGPAGYIPMAAGSRDVSLSEGLRTIEASETRAPSRKEVSLGPVTPPPDAPEPMVGQGDDVRQDEPRGAAAATADPPAAPKVITAAQLKRLWTLIRKSEVAEDRVKEILLEITGQESTKEITKDLYDAVYASIQAEPKEEK